MAKTYGEFLKRFISKVEGDAVTLSQIADDKDFESMFSVVEKMEANLGVIKEFCEAHIAETKRETVYEAPSSKSYKEDYDNE